MAFTRTWTLLDSVSGVAVSKSVSLQSVLVQTNEWKATVEGTIGTVGVDTLWKEKCKQP